MFSISGFDCCSSVLRLFCTICFGFLCTSVPNSVDLSFFFTFKTFSIFHSPTIAALGQTPLLLKQKLQQQERFLTANVPGSIAFTAWSCLVPLTGVAAVLSDRRRLTFFCSMYTNVQQNVSVDFSSFPLQNSYISSPVLITVLDFIALLTAVLTTPEHPSAGPLPWLVPKKCRSICML